MARYLLSHRHRPDECGAAFAAWKGFSSPLRGRPTLGSCVSGGHELWWEVEAVTEAEAVALLPRFVAERTTLAPIQEVQIP